MLPVCAEGEWVWTLAMASRMQVKPSVTLPDSFRLKYMNRTLVLVPGTCTLNGTSGGPALRLSVRVYSTTNHSRRRLDETYCSPVRLTRSIDSNGVSGECGGSEDDSAGRDRLMGPAARVVMQRWESTDINETVTIFGKAMGKECIPGISIHASCWIMSLIYIFIYAHMMFWRCRFGASCRSGCYLSVPCH